jgi:YbbR domain-containing protein
VAERARNSNGRSVFPRARTFGTTAVTAGQQLNWIWTRESLLRLLLSVVLAVALWLYVTNRENPRIVQDYGQPLVIQTSTIPQGTVLANDQLGLVYLRIRRTDPNVPVTPASFRVFVDLSGLKPGRHRVPVQVVSDPGIEVVGKQPSTVPVLLVPKANKQVPVKVEALSKPPPGFGWSFTYKPSSVKVTGPADLVSQVKRATAYVDLHGLTSTHAADYRVNPENDTGSGVAGGFTLRPARVHVTASIHPYSSYKTLPVLVQLGGLPKQGFGVAGVKVTPAEIAASASPSALRHVSTLHTMPLSVNRRGGGTFKKTIQVQLPKGLHAHTHKVTVQVKIAPIQSSTSVEIGIQPRGAGSGLVTHIVPGRLLVTVTGSSNALRSIARSMHATVVLSGLGPGVYRLQPQVRSRQKGVNVDSVYPRKVTVQLRSTR